jgi:predicted RNA-binding protein with EMAP domain
MTADEIRNTNHGEISYLREIAAQLAEHNQHLGRIEFLLENIIDFNRGGLQVNVNRAS